VKEDAMKMKLLLAVALGLALLAITSAVALSWSDVDPTSGFGPDFMVSLPLDDQSAPAVAYNSTDQQFFVVWQDGRGNEWDIYAQIVLTTGVPITNNIVVRDEANKLMDPAVAHSTISDTYLVVWNDQNAGDIEARIVNADDGSLGALFDVEVMTSTHPAVAYNSTANQYLVVYAREIAANNRDIYGRLVRPDGTFGGPAFVICDDANDQDKPDVVHNATANEYLVVWHDGRGTGWDIYGRRVTAAGVATGTEIPISTAANDQTDPAVAWNGAAGYLVVWQDSRNSTTDTDIYARRIDQGGNPQPNEIRLSPAGAQQAPDVAYTSGVNPWLVIWEDCRNQASSGIDVYGQRLPLTGAPAGQGNFVIYDGPNDQKHAALAATGAGPAYLVVWEDQRSGDGLEVVGQGISMAPGGLNRYDLNVSAPLGSQENPRVAYNPNAQQFFVVWQDGRQNRANEWDIYGQIVLTSGIPITDNIVVQNEEHALMEPAVAYSTISNTYLVVWDDQYGGDVESRVVRADGTLGTAQDVFGGAITVTQPAIAYNSAANEYLVVFAYRASATNQDIYGQRVAPNGTLNGTAFPICNDATNQSNPDVVYNAADDEYLVVWYDERNGGSKPWDIYGQRVTASGTVTVTGDPIMISIATGDQYDPSVTWNSDDDEYLVVWRDGRNFGTNGYDIYGQRIDADGIPRGEVPIVTTNGTQTAPHANYIVTLKRYFVTWADDRNAVPPTWDIYGQNVNPDGSLNGGLVQFFAFSDDQQRPDGDFSPEANRGLTVWQDRRNGTTYKIYGRIKAPRFPVYLPLVLRNTQ
jgi:hypothetical protein